MNTVCLVIPCLDEERALRSNIPRLVNHLRTLPGIQWDVVIVDNDSTDSTAVTALELAAQFPEVCLLRQPRRGRGNAIRLAWESRCADVLAYLDADLAVDLTRITQLVTPIINGSADVVYGDRFATGSTVRRSRFREILSQSYRRIARAMLGVDIDDFQCGFKAIRSACRDQLLGSIENSRWFFDTELLVLAEVQGLRTRGIPVHWRDRNETRVRFLPTIVSNLWLLLKLRWRLAGQHGPGVARPTVPLLTPPSKRP